MSKFDVSKMSNEDLALLTEEVKEETKRREDRNDRARIV
jgi:hypothetical protein